MTGEDLDFSVYSALPDVQKKQLCLDLLTEFGADQINETHKGELQHQCTLPLGGHTDRDSLTASINYKKLTFKCFVCNNSGGLLWWIAVNRHESVTDSKTWLRDAAGFTSGIGIDQLLTIIDSLFHPKIENRVMPRYDERLLARWTEWPMHHPYLTMPWLQGGREIPVETLDRFKIGYCDRDDDWRYYQRIIIPLFWQGTLVGWQARRLDPQDPEPAKYKNSPDVPRDRILYGDLDGAKDWCVLVESPASVLRHAHHLPMLATLGASVSPLQVPLLHRFKRVYLFFDNDKAGWDALSGTSNRYGKQLSAGLIEQLRPFVEVFVVGNPYGSITGRPGAPDASDFTDEQVQTLVADAVPAVLWHRPVQQELTVYTREEPPDMSFRKFGTGEIISADPQDEDDLDDQQRESIDAREQQAGVNQDQAEQ